MVPVHLLITNPHPILKEEGVAGAQAPGGAKTECWEQAPPMAPRMMEDKDGEPTARNKRKTRTQEAVLKRWHSVSYAK